MPKNIKITSTKTLNIKRSFASSISETSRTRNVLKGLKNLDSKGLGVSVDDDASVEEASFAFLFALGCSLSTETADYSLIQEQTDVELIENENIFDEKSFSNLKPKATLSTDKFANVDDPFYELDDDLPFNKQKSIKTRQEATMPNVMTIAADIFGENIKTNTSGKLKEFS
jgi:hypothetical protein